MSLLLLLVSPAGGSATNAQAGNAAGTGAAADTGTTLATAAAPATGTGAAYDATAAVSPAAAIASGSGSAYDTTVTAQGAVPVWTTPADTVSMNPLPELKFTMPDLGAAMHFWLELDTANTFDTGDLRTIRSDLSQTGWDFWDGDSWEPVPTGGVASTYAGNEGRHTVQTTLSSTTWYRRIRAGS